MLEHALIKGLLIGLIFGVPAGAIGALTIQRTISYGFSAGFVTGLGSSVMDLLYDCVGIFGLRMISDFLTANQLGFNLLGGGLIIAMGVVIFRKRVPKNTRLQQTPKLSACFISSFAIRHCQSCDALIVNTQPEQGYASISTVNLDFLDLAGEAIGQLPEAARPWRPSMRYWME